MERPPRACEAPVEVAVPQADIAWSKATFLRGNEAITRENVGGTQGRQGPRLSSNSIPITACHHPTRIDKASFDVSSGSPKWGEINLERSGCGGNEQKMGENA